MATSIPFTLHALTQHLAVSAHGFGFLANAALRRFLVGPAQLHLAKRPLPLHLFLQHTQRCIDVIVADEYLHTSSPGPTSAAFMVTPRKLVWQGSVGERQMIGRLLPAIFDDLVADLLSFMQGIEASALDRRDMDENVPAPIGRLNEAESLLRIEPFH